MLVGWTPAGRWVARTCSPGWVRTSTPCGTGAAWWSWSASRVWARAPWCVRVDTVARFLGDGGVAQTQARAHGVDAGQVRASAVAGTPTERFTHPDEVAAFLASGTGGNITGADVLIEGGMVTTV